MVRRTLLGAAASLVVAAPAPAADPPPAHSPQQAVDAVRRVLKRTMPACRTDWTRIEAVGFDSDWRVAVRIRASKAGAGTARWSIGTGWPIARNALARAIAHGCRAT